MNSHKKKKYLDYGEAVETVIYGENVDTMIIPQAKLTSDCWGIQMRGLSACNRCEFLNTEECGGKALREKYLNKLEV